MRQGFVTPSKDAQRSIANRNHKHILLTGTAGDSLSFHRGMKFSTVDQDNDAVPTNLCTTYHPGGWWFSNCLHSNLNGVFDTKTNGLYTLYWKTISQPIIKTEMKIQAYKKGTLS